MAFLATLTFVFVLIVRPHEIWPALYALHLLEVFTVLAALGVVVDFVRGRQAHAYSPQLPFLGAFVAISYLSTILALGREGWTLATTRVAISAIFMLVIMYGARTYTRLRAVIALLLALAFFVSVVAVHQGQVEPQCIELPAVVDADTPEWTIGTPDGRSCDRASTCNRGGRDGVEYACERIGMFETTSTGRRVRWRGQLGDPNELSVFLGALIPLLLMVSASIKRWYATASALAMIGLILYTIILTQSRGGQLVVATVFGVYFVARVGLKGLVIAAALALPVLFFGGRGGEDAESSAEGRVELLYDGITLLAQHPIVGIGVDQFFERRGHTAHNAYLLAAVELGLPGFLCWSGLVWASVKVPILVVMRPPPTIDPRVRALATALLVSFAGMAVGIFFLSFTYKQLLFVWLGLAGALYGIVKNEDDAFRVAMTWKDFAGLAAFDVVLLTGIYVFSRLRAA